MNLLEINDSKSLKSLSYLQSMLTLNSKSNARGNYHHFPDMIKHTDSTLHRLSRKMILSIWIKEVFSDYNNIILCHESEDIHQKILISKISADSNFTFSN